LVELPNLECHWVGQKRFPRRCEGFNFIPR